MATPVAPNPAAPPPMSQEDYFSEVELLRDEIEGAVIIHHTAEAINRMSLNDENVFAALNRDAQFWKTYVHCLQTSLFLTLSRIFDLENNAHSIHFLLNATLANVQIFSESALRTRKTKDGIKEEWIAGLVARAWCNLRPGFCALCVAREPLRAPGDGSYIINLAGRCDE